MADIELRFHKDMLVLSAPVAFALERQGVNMQEDGELVMLMEPETGQDVQAPASYLRNRLVRPSS